MRLVRFRYGDRIATGAIEAGSDLIRMLAGAFFENGVGTLVTFVTQFMTLLPGDVIMTGTPEGVGKLAPGDVVEVEIEGIGVLRNEVGP